jgi:hypothetical protein
LSLTRRIVGEKYPEDPGGRLFPTYLSLGDSYSAGPGSGLTWSPQPAFSGIIKGYFQSNNAWPVQLTKGIEGNLNFGFSACTGYNIDDIKDRSINGPNPNFRLLQTWSR